MSTRARLGQFKVLHGAHVLMEWRRRGSQVTLTRCAKCVWHTTRCRDHGKARTVRVRVDAVRHVQESHAVTFAAHCGDET